MSRPRIRTIKPEAQQDENVGSLRRDARLLFFCGLVTMADDEGRLRAMPAAILGHTFPYDEDVTPAKLRKWLEEIEASTMILRYEHDGVPYIAIRHFRRHQRVDKPTPSILPPPPDREVVADNSPNGPGSKQEHSTNDPGGVEEDPGAPRARGGSDRIRSGSKPPLAPPVGGRERQREKWMEGAIEWARSLGVEGERSEVLRALRQAEPWKCNGDAAERFIAHVRQHTWHTLTAGGAA